MSETNRPKTQATPLRAMDRKRGRSGGRQIKKQKPPAGIYKVRAESFHLSGCELSSRASGKFPSYPTQPSKAGIHRKTLEYWLRTNKAGHNGYDIVREGIMLRFHEHCASAIGEAEDRIDAAAWDFTMGRMIYETDKNGNRVPWGFRGPNTKMHGKMLRFLLEWGASSQSLASVGRSTFRR